MMYLWGGLLLGLAGSMHCVGMCGPLVLALPGKNGIFSRFLGLRLVYNLGRVLTYTWMGLLLGIFGKGIQLSGFQEVVSLSTGALLLLWVIAPKIAAFSKLPRFSFGWLTQWFGDIFYKATVPSQFFTGMLNGLLPCGMVYMAVASALLVGDPTDSALFMAAFGMGTVPALLMVAILDRKILPTLRPLFQKFSTALVVVLAVVFILRGLGLGIPFLSPDTSTFYTQEAPASCH